MQRRALKQLNKVTQWTSEKVFSGEKTQLSPDFLEFEKEIEVRRIGIERLHATSLPFYEQLTKVKSTADPYPPPGSGKDKISYTEALGLVMIDYGDEIGDDYGDALSKYGRARCRLASAQEEFASRLGDSYIAGMESGLAAVNEYKSLRKKLDSRRLALDAAITKSQNSKKDTGVLEEEVSIARIRFEEIEDETHSRMVNIQEAEDEQYALLTDLLEAEVDYHIKCKEILEDLRNSWGTHSSRKPLNTRARSSTVTSSRSLGRTAIGRPHSSKHNTVPSSEDDAPTSRSRSQSNASSSGKSKEKRSMLPSLGSFGRKSGFSNVTSSKKKEKKEKYSESRTALHSEEEGEDEGLRWPAPADRSQSQLSSSVTSYKSSRYDPPPTMRRTVTSPPTPAARYPDPNARYVKALYDYQANASDELSLRVGMIVKVQTQVNDDWWIGEGEIEGKSGLFPRGYTEEYIPSPRATVPLVPSMATRRNLPPPVGQPTTTTRLPPSPNLSLNSDFSESESNGFYDGDNNFTASLAASPQPTATRSAGSGKKMHPAPPASRRAASSNNILDLSRDMSDYHLSPPIVPYGRARSGTTGTVRGSSHEASPFAGSEDDEADDIRRGY
ncbi:hypothetical protein C359_02348 [Cryptococcus neoformans Bt120]|nr:hypothetical protein C359_02348 [Cryptococcus neoformans var. grubii Bt120]